ncbi:hypothetical protein [Amycolatopsis alkalitolerans]|nr:hypothetical protein [Amycolatopsis alkalitolerans]
MPAHTRGVGKGGRARTRENLDVFGFTAARADLDRLSTLDCGG